MVPLLFVFLDLLELKPVEDPHVSLSKVGALKYAQIPEFASSLRKALQTFPKQLLTFHSFRAFVNENKSRTFLGLKVRADSLNEIVDTLDIVLEDEFNMDPFYESRSFHVSLLWALGDQEKVLNSRIEAIRGKWNSFLACEEGVRIKKGIQVSEIQGKTGNKIFNFALT